MDGSPENKQTSTDPQPAKESCPLKCLKLPMRVHEPLRRHGISTVGELLEIIRDDKKWSSRIRGVGVTRERDVIRGLEKVGFDMPEEDPEHDHGQD